MQHFIKHIHTLTWLTFLLLFVLLLSGAKTATSFENTRWPRVHEKNGNEVVMYQPQPGKWGAYEKISAKAAIAVLGKGEQQPVYGAIYIEAKTSVDMDTRTVWLRDFTIARTHFPNVEKDEAVKLDRLVRATLPETKVMPVSLDRLLASLKVSEQGVNEVVVNLDPPPIYYSDKPAILVIFLGEPRFEAVKGTNLLFGVNTNWDVFMNLKTSQYYLLNGDSWLTTKDVLKGPWKTVRAPAELYKLPKDDNWLEVHKHLGASPKSVPPQVYVSDRPAELLVVDGTPSFSPISKTKLLYIANTGKDIFLYPGNEQYYVLLAGRWFTSDSLEGPWAAATKNLPSEFLKIPAEHKKGRVLASVPGSLDAETAVLLASVPKKVTINRSSITVKVAYEGEPQFTVIDGTSSAVYYALNTENSVFRISGKYYVCHQAVWFASSTPYGPWVVSTTVPQVIYTIPVTHPTHNVTYVYVYDSTPTTVVVGYTSGYTGAYVAADVVMFGLGVWAVSAMIDHHHDYHHYHYHHSHYFSYGSGAKYSYNRGGYYRSAEVYGPYGGAGRGAKYDPVSGGYQRGAYRYGPNGGAFAREAYNPHTGRYAGQAGASNAYGSLGRSVVADGNDWARAGHRSNPYGSVAGFETSKGAAGIAGKSNVTGRSGYAARDKYGDTYVGRDGNIYKNNDGNWQKATKDGWQGTNYKKSSSQNYNRPAESTSAQNRANYDARKQQAQTNYNTQKGQAKSNYSSTGRQQVESNLNRQYQGRQVGERNASTYQSQRATRSSGRSGRSGRAR